MGLIGFILLITVVMLFEARDRIKRLELRLQETESAIKGLQPNSPTLSDSLEIVSAPDDPAPEKPFPTEAQQDASATFDPEFAAATEVIPLQPTMADEQKTDAARELVKGYRMPARVISK